MGPSDRQPFNKTTNLYSEIKTTIVSTQLNHLLENSLKSEHQDLIENKTTSFHYRLNSSKSTQLEFPMKPLICVKLESMPKKFSLDILRCTMTIDDSKQRLSQNSLLESIEHQSLGNQGTGHLDTWMKKSFQFHFKAIKPLDFITSK